MKYMGSKRRLAKWIVPIVLEHLSTEVFYVEPFVGGGNMIQNFPNRRCIGSDIDKYAIAALMLIKNELNLIPTDSSVTSEAVYYKVRDNKDKYHPGLVGYYGYALSYGGKFFGGWRRDKTGKRDYINEAYRAAVKQSDLLQNTILVNSSYNDILVPKNSVIYCDPPYQNSTRYRATDFDHSAFWVWCRRMSSRGHKLFISEYNAPDDFVCVWQKKLASSLTQNTGDKISTEKLFAPRGQ